MVHFVIDEVIIKLFKWTCSRSGNNAGPWLELCSTYWLFSFHLAEHFHKHFLGLFSGNKTLIPVGCQRSQPSPYLFLMRVKWTLRFPAASRLLWIHCCCCPNICLIQLPPPPPPPQASAVSHSWAGSVHQAAVFTHVPGEAAMVLFPLFWCWPAVSAQTWLCVRGCCKEAKPPTLWIVGNSLQVIRLKVSRNACPARLIRR